MTVEHHRRPYGWRGWIDDEVQFWFFAGGGVAFYAILANVLVAWLVDRFAG